MFLSISENRKVDDLKYVGSNSILSSPREGVLLEAFIGCDFLTVEKGTVIQVLAHQPILMGLNVAS